jgi:hypothetical protein
MRWSQQSAITPRNATLTLNIETEQALVFDLRYILQFILDSATRVADVDCREITLTRIIGKLVDE